MYDDDHKCCMWRVGDMWGIAKVRSKVRVIISIDVAASRKSSSNSTQFAMLSSSNPATFNLHLQINLDWGGLLWLVRLSKKSKYSNHLSSPWPNCIILIYKLHHMATAISLQGTVSKKTALVDINAKMRGPNEQVGGARKWAKPTWHCTNLPSHTPQRLLHSFTRANQYWCNLAQEHKTKLGEPTAPTDKSDVPQLSELPSTSFKTRFV